VPAFFSHFHSKFDKACEEVFLLEPPYLHLHPHKIHSKPRVHNLNDDGKHHKCYELYVWTVKQNEELGGGIPDCPTFKSAILAATISRNTNCPLSRHAIRLHPCLHNNSLHIIGHAKTTSYCDWVFLFKKTLSN
jgi:hypothetical protein